MEANRGKKRILFLLNGRAENWASDDSQDETYVPNSAGTNSESSRPTQETATNLSRKKRKKTKESRMTKGKVSHREVILPPRQEKREAAKNRLIAELATPGPWGTNIPPEILVKIFQFVIRMDGAVQFLHRAAKVCTLWNKVSYHPRLWEVMDLSSLKLKSEEKFIWLCKNRLSHLKELDLSQWGASITHKGLKAVSDNCPRLTNINLSGCKKLSASDVRLLADNCVNLSAIDLSYTANRSSAENPVSPNTLKYLMNKCGQKIVYFSMANNIVTGIPLIVNTICENCPNLRALDISNVSAANRDLISLNIECLQESCKQLQALRLANTLIRLANVPLTKQASSPGFPKLKELSIAAKGDSYVSTIEDGGLHRILKTSEELELLDVRGCRRISTSGLVRLPAWNMRHLFLSQCSAAMDLQLELVMQKWKSSLIEVDLSWNNHINNSLDIAINALTSDSETSQLQILDLCGSSVTFESVKNVLSNCQHLRTLNLTSCRGLPRGMKRLYQEDALVQLKEDIESAKFVQYEEVT